MSRLVSASSLNKPPLLVVLPKIWWHHTTTLWSLWARTRYPRRDVKVAPSFSNIQIQMEHNYKIDGVFYKQAHLWVVFAQDTEFPIRSLEFHHVVLNSIQGVSLVVPIISALISSTHAIMIGRYQIPTYLNRVNKSLTHMLLFHCSLPSKIFSTLVVSTLWFF